MRIVRLGALAKLNRGGSVRDGTGGGSGPGGGGGSGGCQPQC
jgi:hypothetical protein